MPASLDDITAPGIPMLFIGQEFLEDKQCSDAADRVLVFQRWIPGAGDDV